ncbi:beta-N-acetylhexosaminidase [Saccharothrix longispora]|uniref:beta-N-acetylhexosaminidase n=1 Tax=Saccharothrix longispora TaxID=33920 RepID=UPI0028FD8D03|nr:beta-N-acetylhexosaminidase [Saccharothrix longispora]MDU0287892.1 beta-N-acetylhexosaminidase [Saccharothrix longispora]
MIVPRPTRVVRRHGRFALDEDTAIRATPGAEGAARLLRHLLRPATGLPLPLHEDGRVVFALDERLVGLGDEGYALTVNEHAVVLRAATRQGLAHGVQTIRQLLPAQALGSRPASGVEWALPGVDVRDTPRLPWRGVLLDVARHFQPAPVLRRFVDLLALHKLNVLHLHLTDDQGWRMPVPRYPLLTEVGGRRAETAGDGVPHGGAYTRSELAGLVAYAAERGVRVVPEIEMPGHARAALAAYPHLGNDPGRRLPVWTRWGVSDAVFGVGDATLEFCRDVLDEVLEVFPGRHVHLGGDECPTTEWESGAGAAERVAREGLAGPHELHGWFLRAMADHLVERGRVPVSWERIGDPRAVVMPWRDADDARSALDGGHDVVMAPHRSTYLDYPQTADPDEPAGQPGLVVTAHDVYHLPLPTGVLGAQCALWTEYAPTPHDLERLAFPRLAALADALWSQRPSWTDFTDRMREHGSRLTALAVPHRPLDTRRPPTAREEASTQDETRSPVPPC